MSHNQQCLNRKCRNWQCLFTENVLQQTLSFHFIADIVISDFVLQQNLSRAWLSFVTERVGETRIHISVSKTVDIMDNWTQRTNL